MDSTLQQDPSLLPRREDGLGTGAGLAVGAHLLLIAALAFGVSWQVGEPEAVTAELWSAVPQVAAPPAAEPPPPPPAPAPAPRPVVKEAPPPEPVRKDADIAVEKEKERREKQAREAEAREREAEKQRQEKARQEKLEQEKAEKDKLEKQRQAEAEKQRRQAAEEARLAKLREENLKRMMGQVGATGAENSAGNAMKSSGPSASYAGKIVAAIRPNIVSIAEFSGNPEAIVGVRAAADGTILGRRLVKSSGDPAWDEEVLRAIDRTGRLPRDENGRVPPDIELKMRPKPVS